MFRVLIRGQKKKFNDYPFAYHQEIELEITTLTNLGLGLGRVAIAERERADPAAPGDVAAELETPESKIENSPDSRPTGWVVMVPFTLPGERVRARIFRNHKNFSEADLVQVLTPSTDRVEPGCPLFGKCGGCQYQHLNYAGQLLWKQRQVSELLEHMAGIEFSVSPVVASPREYGYRSKITPHFNAPRRFVQDRRAPAGTVADEGPEGDAGADPGDHAPTSQYAAPPEAVERPIPIGFLRQGTRFDIIDVPRCPIATDAINLRLGAVREAVHAKAASYTRGATLLLRDANGVVTTDYDAVITETVSVLPHSQGSDFQSQTPAPSQPSGSPSQISHLTSQIAAATQPASGPTSQTSNLKSQKIGAATRPAPVPTSEISNLKSQIAGATQPASGPASQISNFKSQIAAQPPAPLRLHFLARDFFQNNPFILPAFTGYVREQAANSGARFLVDAYCGSGLFALTAASAFERVAGVEISASSVRFAEENAAANGISNAAFLAADAGEIFAGLTFPAAETAVIIDPPRKGCDNSFLQQLFAYGPRAVVYVSCDPATQMRDLRHFLSAGYHLTAAQPFDLFPQTRHLECVLTLVKG